MNWLYHLFATMWQVPFEAKWKSGSWKKLEVGRLAMKQIILRNVKDNTVLQSTLQNIEEIMFDKSGLKLKRICYTWSYQTLKADTSSSS